MEDVFVKEISQETETEKTFSLTREKSPILNRFIEFYDYSPKIQKKLNFGE